MNVISIYTIALFVLSISAHSSRMYAAAYHNLFEPLWYVVALTVTQFVMIWLIVVSVHVVRAKKAAAFLALTACLFFLFKTVRSILPVFLEHHEKVMIILVIIGMSGMISILFEKILHRLFSAMSVMAVIWTFTPIAHNVAASHANTANHEVFNASAAIQEDRKANVILILDELSPEYSDAIIEPLQSLGLHVSYGEAEKAGEGTMKAIPAMLTGSAYDSVSPCSLSSLCGSNYINFSDLRVGSENIDVIGFFHPYCAINGLRSCQRVEAPYFLKGLSIGELTSSLVGELPVVGLLDWAKSSRAEKDEQIYQMTRQIIRSSALSAPIWDEGGVLFIHYLGPHPTGNGHEGSLKAHYESNLTDAAQFTSEIARLLVSTFGESFNLVITSDHPLRSSWCEHPSYVSPSCLDDIPKDRSKVPYITATLGLNDEIPQESLSGFLRNINE